MPDPGPVEVIRFGIFEADLRNCELRRGGSKVRLQDQPFQVLALLLQHAGEIVTREELQVRLWPANTFVDFDHGLNAAIKRLRDALGDSAENPRFIETLARRGYRFLAPVASKSTIAAAAAEPPPERAFPRWRFAVLTAGVLVLGISAGWHAARRSAASLRFEERRLTGTLESDPVLSAAISPDAKYVVFVDRSGLFLRVLATGETHPLGLPEHFKTAAVSWFPDGNHLLLTAISSGSERAGLWSISLFGGTPQQLIENGERGAVSSDGSEIVFLRGDYGREEIWRMDAQGQGARKILGKIGDNFQSVVWSPDKRHIAFVRLVYMHGWEEADASLGICDPVNNNTKYILSSARLRASLAWARDGRLIYSLGEPPPRSADSNLWAIRVDGSGNQTWGEPSRLTNGSDFRDIASISADGRHLLFLRRAEAPEIFVAEVSSQNSLGPLQRLGLEERRNLPFAWTPDSRSVIFASNRDGANHVFKQSVDQPAPDLLVGGEQSVQGVRPSPDGSEILYLLTPSPTDSDRRVRMMSIPLAGGGSRQILAEVGISNAQCARAPSKVCIFSKASAGGLVFLTFDSNTGRSNEFTRIEDQEWWAYNWTLSPDGSTLAVSKKHRIEVPAVIRLLPVAGGVERTISVQPWAGIAYMDWAADGRSLWVRASNPAGTEALLNLDLRGRATPALQETDTELGWAIPSPDGHRLALWKTRSSSSAWLLESN